MRAVAAVLGILLLGGLAIGYPRGKDWWSHRQVRQLLREGRAAEHRKDEALVADILRQVGETLEPREMTAQERIFYQDLRESRTLRLRIPFRPFAKLRDDGLRHGVPCPLFIEFLAELP